MAFIQDCIDHDCIEDEEMSIYRVGNNVAVPNLYDDGAGRRVLKGNPSWSAAHNLNSAGSVQSYGKAGYLVETNGTPDAKATADKLISNFEDWLEAFHVPNHLNDENVNKDELIWLSNNLKNDSSSSAEPARLLAGWLVDIYDLVKNSEGNVKADSLANFLTGPNNPEAASWGAVNSPPPPSLDNSNPSIASAGKVQSYKDADLLIDFGYPNSRATADAVISAFELFLSNQNYPDHQNNENVNKGELMYIAAHAGKDSAQRPSDKAAGLLAGWLADIYDLVKNSNGDMDATSLSNFLLGSSNPDAASWV